MRLFLQNPVPIPHLEKQEQKSEQEQNLSGSSAEASRTLGLLAPSATLRLLQSATLEQPAVAEPPRAPGSVQGTTGTVLSTQLCW